MKVTDYRPNYLTFMV